MKQGDAFDNFRSSTSFRVTGWCECLGLAQSVCTLVSTTKNAFVATSLVSESQHALIQLGQISPKMPEEENRHRYHRAENHLIELRRLVQSASGLDYIREDDGERLVTAIDSTLEVMALARAQWTESPPEEKD